MGFGLGPLRRVRSEGRVRRRIGGRDSGRFLDLLPSCAVWLRQRCGRGAGVPTTRGRISPRCDRYLASQGLQRARIDAYADAPAAVATYGTLGFEVYATIVDTEADLRNDAEE